MNSLKVREKSLEPSTLEKDVVPHSEIPPDTEYSETDWKKEYEMLAKALGRQMLGSDFFYLLIMGLVGDGASKEAMKTLAEGISSRRPQWVKDLMG